MNVFSYDHVSLGRLLFTETRVRALSNDLMLKAMKERLPVELRRMFPTIGIPAVYGGEEKQPFDVIRSGSAGMEAEDALWFMLHIGLPKGTDVFTQSRFDIGDGIVKAIREFAARQS